MLTLRTLRLLDKMPTLYREAVDRRCRMASGYGGERPWADELVDWGPDGPETDEIALSRQQRDYYDAYARIADRSSGTSTCA